MQKNKNTQSGKRRKKEEEYEGRDGGRRKQPVDVSDTLVSLSDMDESVSKLS
jgi:hypothetical protein